MYRSMKRNCSFRCDARTPDWPSESSRTPGTDTRVSPGRHWLPPRAAQQCARTGLPRLANKYAFFQWCLCRSSLPSWVRSQMSSPRGMPLGGKNIRAISYVHVCTQFGLVGIRCLFLLFFVCVLFVCLSVCFVWFEVCFVWLWVVYFVLCCSILFVLVCIKLHKTEVNQGSSLTIDSHASCLYAS